MEITRILRFLLEILMIMSSSKVAFNGASADFAPEKMDPENEAFKEMNLEPRSSIPHPMNSVPVTPAAVQAKPLYTSQADNTYKIISGKPRASQQAANVTVEQKMNKTFTTNNTAKQPENIKVAAITTLQNQLTPNATSIGNSFVSQQANQQANLASQTAQTTVSQPHINTTNEEPNHSQNNNITAPVANNERRVASESVSFGTLSKPLTPIKSIPAETNTDDNIKKDESDNQQNSNTTLKPILATLSKSTNAPPVTVAGSPATGSPAVFTVKKPSNIAEKPSETKDLNAGQGGNMKTNKDSSPKVDLDTSGSGDDDEEDEEQESPNNVPHIKEKQDDKDDDNDDDDDDDNDDDSGSGEEENLLEDKEKSFLHDNHTLTSTNGAVKIGTKQEQPIADTHEGDHDMENAVEDALDKETNSADNDVKESEEDNHRSPLQKNNENLDDNKDNIDIMEMEKTTESKPDTSAQKPLESNANMDQTSGKGPDQNPNKVKPLQMPTTLGRNPVIEVHKDLHKQEEPVKQNVHHEIREKTKLSIHKEMKQVQHFKPATKAKVILKESVDKPEKKVFKKPLLKYIHRVTSPVTVENKTASHKCYSDEIKSGYSLKGGTRAGHVNDLGGTASIHDCIKRCCNKKICDVALLLDGRCFGVSCFSKELCQPIAVPHPHYVSSKIAFLNQAERRTEVERTRPEYDCKYGELTIRNNHRWSGELCGGVVSCKNGIIHLEKCPGIPPKPKDCANPKLFVKQRPGQCCIKKWHCKDKSCMYGPRKIPHGVSLSDPLCTGIITCFNGHLKTTTCPDIPNKPTNCANPRLKITTVPGKCCQRKWVCEDKSCTYNKLKIDHGERLTDASCAGIMECNNGYLHFKQCPSPPAIPHGCLNPRLVSKRVLGECCKMKWTCAADI